MPKIAMQISLQKQIATANNRLKLWRESFAALTRKPKRLSISTCLAIGALITLTCCLFTIPPMIKNSVNGLSAEQLARERLTQMLHDELSQDIHQEIAELLPTKPIKKSNADGGNGTSGSSRTESYLSQDLLTARWLVSKGKLEKAIPFYEAYLQLDPNAIKAHIELINVSIATKQGHKARLLCIRTLKKQLTSDEISTVWQLMSQCQTDQ